MLGLVLLLGILVGVKHAIEADHVAAVASLVTRSRDVSEAVSMGVAWGLGHTLTLVLVGALTMSFSIPLQGRLALALEFGVGLMLIWLGIDVLRRLTRDRVHFHAHRHDAASSGIVHFHAHSHRGETVSHSLSPHLHRHQPMPVRALLVGVMHGMAGSAALVLLTMGQIGSAAMAIAYIGLFGLGSILGMAALTAVLAVPLLHTARRLSKAQRLLSAAVGSATVALGAWILFDVAVIEGLLV